MAIIKPTKVTNNTTGISYDVQFYSYQYDSEAENYIRNTILPLIQNNLKNRPSNFIGVETFFSTLKNIYPKLSWNWWSANSYTGIWQFENYSSFVFEAGNYTIDNTSLSFEIVNTTLPDFNFETPPVTIPKYATGFYFPNQETWYAFSKYPNYSYGDRLQNTHYTAGPTITIAFPYYNYTGGYVKVIYAELQCNWLYMECNVQRVSISDQIQFVQIDDYLEPEPISPDEVDTTNEQVGNDVNYNDVHVDVDVLVPTNDNEENFSTSTITDTNIVSVYALTNSEVRDFSTYIWSNASQGLWQALTGQLQNPMDVILSLHTIPYANSDGTFKFSTQASNIALAGIDSGIESRKVLKDNFQDFVGSVNLTSFIRHNFVDFPPYTELSIYLPYLGYVDLDLNDFRDRVGDDDSLGLHYIVEPMTGNFIAKLTSFKKNYKGVKDDATSSLDGSVMYSFSGNMARQLPLANRHFDILGGLAGIGSSLLMGGVQATMAKKPIGGIVGGVTGAIGSVIDMMTPKVSHNGNLGGNFGYLDSNVARIIMRSTPYYIPSNYGLTTGYVVNSYYSSFAKLVGLVVIENWIPKNMSRATLEEITELEKLLKEGVYFGDGIWNETEEQESD